MRRVINTFTAGELSPLMAGRLDLADVMARGSRRLKNFQIHPTGGIFRRSGLRYLDETKSPATPVVLIPFQRDAHTVYQLEAGEQYLRVWNRNGTLANVDLLAPWSAGHVHGLYYVQSNDVMLIFWDGPPQVLSRTAAGWTLTNFSWKYPPLRDENVTGTQLSCTVADTSATGFLEATEDLFEPGHAGSWWQISHVREEPFVKLDLGAGSGTASALLTITAHPAAGEQVKIGGVIYKFVPTGTAAAAHEVDRGGDAAAAAANLIGAIAGGSGTYGPGTVAHPLVEAVDAGALAGGSKATAILTITWLFGTGAYVIINGRKYTWKVTPAVADDVKLGGTMTEHLDNLRRAINASGTEGTHYGTGTAVNTHVEAGEVIDNTLVITAKAVGTAGNYAVTRWSGSGPGEGWLFWSGPAMTGGANTNTERIRVTARDAGDHRPLIEVTATLAAGSWSSATLEGGVTLGADPAAPHVSSELRVTGKWEVFSVGAWTGKMWLDNKNGSAWEVLRTWTAEGDYNIQTTGEVTTDTTMRLRFTGTGEVSASPSFNAPNPRAQLTALSAEVKGLVRVLENGIVTPRKANVEVVKPLFPAAGLTGTAPTARWCEGAFSSVRGFPRAACFHEQRLVLGGAQDEPERLHFSATADLFNFERTGLDDSGFAFDLAATESSPVVTLASMGDGLFCGTEGGEWLIKGAEGRAMTPSSRTALPKNAIGGAAIKPLVFGARVLFVQAAARALREFVFDWQDQNYVVPDLTDASAHLVRKGIRCIAFVRKPAPVIYAVTNDGHLLSCLYRRESQLVAWADHTTTDGQFEWVSVNTSPDSDDQVWFIINRDNKRYVEKFDDLHFENLQYGTAADMLHCDAAVTVQGTISEITGLDHLDKKTVVILADGKQVERTTVVDSKVTLKEPAGKVTVGLPYVSEVQPMPVEIPLQDGAASGRVQKSGPLSVHLFRSLALRYADSAETPHPQRYEFNFRDGADESQSAPPLFTGWRPMSPPAKFRDAAEVVLSTDEPLPLNILAIAPTSQVYGA